MNIHPKEMDSISHMNITDLRGNLVTPAETTSVIIMAAGELDKEL